LSEAELNWAKLVNAKHSAEKLASIIYKPLYENDASKAIAAQYAAHLIRTGDYGRDEELFNKLPPYLKTALSYLTTKPTAAISTGTTAPIATTPTGPTITTNSMTEGVK
ncbi:MAG: hypothetical protein ACRDC6_22710, partial [Shewanella sp.]